MSVRLHDKEEFIRVAQTIRSDHNLREFFFTIEDFAFRRSFGLNPDPKPYDIYAFVERLYIANRLAYSYQYGDDDPITIPRLKKEDFAGMPYRAKEFIEILNSIRYNLYTNNGQCFLGQEDMERIDRLLDTARWLYIAQLEEELGRR